LTKSPFYAIIKIQKEREVIPMTEFEIIKKALARVRADLEIYDFPTSKSIHIPIYTLLAPNGIELQLEFDGEGKLIETYTWD
jgi:hypothetical protein